MAASSPAEHMTMGNYADLPPDQRPGYVHQAQAAAQYQYAQPGHLQYTSAPAAGQHYAYTASPRDSAPAFQYASTPGNITFTAQPVAGSAAQPAIRHTAHPTSSPYAPVPAHPQYAAVSHAPAPPPVVQGQYPPPPMGTHSPRPEHHRAQSSAAPAGTYD